MGALLYHGIMGRLDFRAFLLSDVMLVFRCLCGCWNSDLMAGTFLSIQMLRLADVIDCRFLLYLSVTAGSVGRGISGTKKCSTNDSINQVSNQNNSIKRPKFCWLLLQQTQFTDNPYVVALTALWGSNLYPLLEFFKYQGKLGGNSWVHCLL